MIIPDYEGNSIVNLVSTIIAAEGHDPEHAVLRDIDATHWGDYKNIVLIVLDGLGDHFLKNKFPDSFLNRHRVRRMTSVFPTTTAAAITSFLSAQTPIEHAITGWYMYLRELGAASVILPFKPRYGKTSYDKEGVDVSKILDFDRAFSHIYRKKCYVTPSHLIGSAYTNYSGIDSEKFGYNSFNGFFQQLSRAVRHSEEKKYVYAYWSKVDALMHKHGTFSKEVADHFQELDQRIERFVNNVKNDDTLVLITADHGLIDTTPIRALSVDDYPRLKDFLILPLCGEPRVCYAYVRSGKTFDFLHYMEDNLANVCKIITRDEAIQSGVYGEGIPGMKFRDRIGDFILLMNENYVLKDHVLGEVPPNFIGYHGGLSEEELFVPLIMIK